MLASTLRQHYRPKADRMPGWLRRIWGWLYPAGPPARSVDRLIT